jgi:hypothetical protein
MEEDDVVYAVFLSHVYAVFLSHGVEIPVDVALPTTALAWYLMLKTMVDFSCNCALCAGICNKIINYLRAPHVGKRILTHGIGYSHNNVPSPSCHQST